MTRPKLSLPGQPLPLRIVLRAFEALASLKLGVLLILAAAVVLAWATWMESRYGAGAVRFGIYGTGWFAGLVFLIGLNVLCAAWIRFPWRRYQTGFVITHAGILVLLAGCLLSWLRGIDAQMPVFEQTSAHRVFADTQHLELAVYGPASDSRETVGFARDEASASSPQTGESPAITEIPFAAGPFNWSEYERLSWFPWHWAHRDRGVVYDRDGIRLEVLDYLSDSKTTAVPPLKLKVQTRAGKTPTANAPKPEGDSWQSIELNVRDVPNPHTHERRMGLGERYELPGGPQIVFWVAGSWAETEAFLNSRPDGPLGSKGQIVLNVGGNNYTLSVDALSPGSRVPLGETGLQVELARLDSRLWGAALRVVPPVGSPRRLMLLADYPEFNQHDEEHGVFGTYWCHAPAPSEKPPGAGEMRGLGQPRIDILQGADRKLYCRVWKPPGVEALGELPADGTRQVAFPGTADQVTWYVEEFTPHDRPGVKILPVPFSAKKSSHQKLRRALVRLTVDGVSEQFWLDGTEPTQFDPPPRDGQRRVVCGNGRRVAVRLAWDEIDIGFRVYLQSFHRKLDPGTSMASHYSSLVDFLPAKTDDDSDHAPGDRDRALRRDVLITLNEPVNFSDPRTGRSYRLFQESFNGPWKPGDEQFDQLVPSGSDKDQLFVSFLTVNYDPGRGLKYTGSLLVIAGVATMFYMRAYFFKRRTRRDSSK